MASDARKVGGWDIGGVNVKAAVVEWQAGEPANVRVVVRPFEIWREPERLPAVLAEIAEELGLGDAQAIAVTMTAELSDAFPTRSEGVRSVLDGVERAFSGSPSYVLSTAGDFATPAVARRRPLDFAATNWVASSRFTAGRHPDCILVDVGSTTTDVIPIRAGRVVCEGRTDLARLGAGELVYSGVLRTNPNAVVQQVPVQGRLCRVAAEYFAVMADVYLLLGRVAPEAYSCPTADGRAKSAAAAGQRLARLVCSDRETLGETEILLLARYLAEKQLQQLTEAVLQVLSRSGASDGDPPSLVVAGAGAFLAAEVGRRLGLGVVDLAAELGAPWAVALPAPACACLLARQLEGERS